MRVTRPLLFALLPLFASCQVFDSTPNVPTDKTVRLQGELSVSADQLVLTPCAEQRRFHLIDSANSGLLQEARALLADGQGPLFADLRGSLGSSQQAGADGELAFSQLYRLQREGPGCTDPNFKRQTLRASGHEPDWSVSVSANGLVLERPGQPALALPYVEEQLPESRFNLTSEANGQRLELWIAPQRCVDSMSGTVQTLTAELRLDGQTQRGCAYFGGARNE